MARQIKTKSDYARAWQRKKMAEGKCVTCGLAKEHGDRWRCNFCAARSNEQAKLRKYRKEEGICTAK